MARSNGFHQVPAGELDAAGIDIPGYRQIDHANTTVVIGRYSTADDLTANWKRVTREQQTRETPANRVFTAAVATITGASDAHECRLDYRRRVAARMALSLRPRIGEESA